MRCLYIHSSGTLLHDAVGGGGSAGIVKFPEKKHYEGVYIISMLLALRGSGCQFSRKNVLRDA